MTRTPPRLVRPSCWPNSCRRLLALTLLLLGLRLEGPLPARAAPGDLLNETFASTTLSTPWTFGSGGGSAAACLTAGGPLGCSAMSGGGATGALPDASGSGALRLTNNQGNQAGFALSNTVIPAGKGISVSFDHYAYGGVGGDGMTFFLINGSANPGQAGSFGGSLGYAQRLTPSAQPGIAGGYIGISIDEFGNFANANEGRGNGCTTTYGQPGSAGLLATGSAPDRVTVRGARNADDSTGLSGYCYIASGSVGSSLDNPAPGVTTRNGATKHTVQLTISPLNVLTVRVDGSSVVSGLDLDSVPGQPAFPASFKVGFAGATGGSTNYHEVRNLVVQALAPDLTLTKSHAGNFAAGQAGSYVLQVSNGSNAGPVDATDGITVTDTLPAGLTLANASGTDWNCSALNQMVSCAYQALPVASGTALPPISLVVDVHGAPSQVINTATVTTPRDSNPSNNTASDPTAVTQVADLAVVKQRTTNATPGAPITYSIRVSNNGPSHIQSATVQDNVPVAIGGVTWTCAPIANCSAPAGSGNGINAGVALAAGETVTLTVNGTLSASASGVLSNAATVGGSVDVTDPDPSNNTSVDSYTIPVASTPPSITSPAPPAAQYGTPYQHTVAVTGTQPLTVSLSSGSLPPGLSLDPASGVLSGTPTAAGNFTFTLSATNGSAPDAAQFVTLTVAPAPLTITVESVTRAVGQPNPPFRARYAGFAPGDTAAALSGTLTITSTATPSSPAASYPILASGLSSPNYRITYVTGTLLVGAARLHLPLLLAPAPAPAAPLLDAPISPRAVTSPGTVFYTTTLEIPALIGARYALSSSPTVLAPLLVDDELALLVGETPVFVYDFSASGTPVAAVVALPPDVVTAIAGRTVTLRLRDRYGYAASSTSIYLVPRP
jgi:uncharacterized repeat protein (TIGR01451 family)